LGLKKARLLALFDSETNTGIKKKKKDIEIESESRRDLTPEGYLPRMESGGLKKKWVMVPPTPNGVEMYYRLINSIRSFTPPAPKHLP
jgi:hypothetical protein